MVLEFVHETFGDAKMAYHFLQHHRFGPTWQLYSSSTNTCSCLKEKLSVKDPGTILEPRALITQLCCTFSEGLCHKVVTNVIVATLNILFTRNNSPYTCASGRVVCHRFLQNIVSLKFKWFSIYMPSCMVGEKIHSKSGFCLTSLWMQFKN